MARFGRYDGWDFHANALTWRDVDVAMSAGGAPNENSV
jgi:hypothetical protein